MTIKLKYLISITIAVLIVSCTALGQNTNIIGLELSKTITSNIVSNSRGFVFEPVHIYKSEKMNLNFKSIVGYALVKRDSIYENSNLQTQGFYIKEGIGFSGNDYIVPYISIVATSYQIKNTFYLQGDYFNDFIASYKHRNLFAVGIEPSIDFNAEISEHMILSLNIHGTWVLLNTEDSNFPTYYLPGIGIVDNMHLSAGFNISLLYQLN